MEARCAQEVHTLEPKVVDAVLNFITCTYRDPHVIILADEVMVFNSP